MEERISQGQIRHQKRLIEQQAMKHLAEIRMVMVCEKN